MKRLTVGLASFYLLFAVIGRFVERIGAAECGCDAACWCKKPVLSTFRWVFPFGHRSDKEHTAVLSSTGTEIGS